MFYISLFPSYSKLITMIILDYFIYNESWEMIKWDTKMYVKKQKYLLNWWFLIPDRVVWSYIMKTLDSQS